jgi:transcriptional regulator with XRE-family HTH domain
VPVRVARPGALRQFPEGNGALATHALDNDAMGGADERPGFAGTLREWRNRRRISQLELALETGTTQRHVSFLESGRSSPGRAMVVRLAESLQIPLRDRNALLLAAGYAPAYEETRFDDPELDAVRTALERVLEGHLIRRSSAIVTEISSRPTARSGRWSREWRRSCSRRRSTSHGCSCIRAASLLGSSTSTSGPGT